MTPESLVHLDQGNRWSSFKYLNNVAHAAISTRSSKDVNELELILRKHKPDFLSLLKNPPRSPLHREVVVQSVKDGITVVHQSSRSKKILPKNVVEETLLMSEMFDLNELTALELIITGESQVPRYPGAARGPVAVLLYYDAKRSLLSSLKCLLQAVSGKSWSINLSRDFNRLLTSFLKDLVDNGIVDRALEYLKVFDVKLEFDLLHRNRALGPGKFKRQVYDLITEIKELYSYIVFAFAAQFDLKTETTINLIRTVSSIGALDASGSFDSTTAILVLGTFYALDYSGIESQPHNQTDGQRNVPANLPQIVKDRQALKNIINFNNTTEFSLPQVKTLIKFCLSITVRGLNSCDQNYESITANIDEEKLLDESISEKIFEIVDSMLVRNAVVGNDEFYMLRLHNLLIDLPHLFPMKLKELRDRGDEEGRIVASNIQQGINPPGSLNHHFQKYLILLTNFYSKDSRDLSKNFWRSSDQLFQSNVSEKNVSFSKFVKSTLETFLPQNLRLTLFNLLAALAKSSPFQIFGLLRSSGILHNPQFLLDDIFKSFELYYKSFNAEFRSREMGTSFSSFNNTMTANQPTQAVVVTAMDIDVLCSILGFIESMVSADKTCSISIAENQSYNCIPVFIGLVTCPVSRKLKASLLSCLGGFCISSSSVALNIWSRLDVILPKTQVAVTLSYPTSVSGQRNWTDGVYIEIEDIEPRSEEYPVTIGFLKCISNVVEHVIGIKETTKQAMLETAVNFVVSGILLKVHSRVFSNEEQKWSILSKCLDIVNQILKVYHPLDDETVVKSSFSVMNQILQENLLFRTLMCVIENVSSVLQAEFSSQVVHPPYINKNLNILQEKCLLLSLQIFDLVVEKQSDFLTLVRAIPGFPSAALMSMAMLFANVNPRTSEADRLATLVKVCSIPNSEISVEIMRILRGLISEEPSTSHLCLLQVQPFKKYHDDYILHGFVDSIESGHEELRLEVLKLINDCFQTDSSNAPGYGLAHKLLGFDRKLQLRTPGSLDQTYTCLHSIVATIENEPEPSASEERFLCLKILLNMSTSSATRSVTLRFLRTSYDLMANYLNHRNRLNEHEFEVLVPEIPLFWKLLATEIKTVADSSLKSHGNNYIRLLLGADGNKKLLELIPLSVFNHSYPEMPSWEYFDSKELWNTISLCSENGIVDVKTLHQNILHEVRQFSSQMGSNQAGSIQNEIKSILTFASNLNASRKELDLKIPYVEGWRDLVETILLTNSLEIFEEKTRAVQLLQLVNEILAISSSPDTITSLMSPLSSIILIATTVIRKMPAEVISKTNLLTTTGSLINVIESPSSADTWNQLKRARVNLYAALLHLIRSLDVPRDLKLTSRLLDRLVKDALTGVELVKVLALSILAECDTSWVNELASDGSLRILIESLIADDKEIKASKCDKLSKAFYSFEAKMTLLIGIASTQPGARTLIHLGITDCLLNLETFEIYPNLMNKNEVCFKIFTSVLKLVLLLVDMSIPSDEEVLAKFLTCKSHLFYDLMKATPEAYRETREGKIVIPQIVALTSKLILFTDSQLQKSFISFAPLCCELKSETDPQILTSVLQGCIRFISQNPLTPLFLPSWDCRDNFMSFGQPSIGLLIPIIENSVLHLKQLERDRNSINVSKRNSGETDTLYKILIESSLDVIWHHLNLFSSAIELTNEEAVAIKHLQIKSVDFLNESLFGAVQTVIKDNTFVDATIRRINRIVNLQTTSQQHRF